MLMLTNEMNINNKSDLSAKKKKNRVLLPTIRFELKIEKPSGDSFCEFNYNKLALKVFKKCKKKNKIENKKRIKSIKLGELTESTSEVDSFQKLSKEELNILENDLFIDRKRIEELVSIYEKKIYLSKEADDDEKYLNDDEINENEFNEDEDDDMDDQEIGDMPSINNNKGSKKSKSKSAYEFDNNKYKLRDFSYLGHGYDENDSFIDNSEAQDVRVPSNMAPKRGGFYINKEEIQLEKIKKTKKSASNSKKNNDVNRIIKNESAGDNNEDEEDEEDEDYSYDSEESFSGSSDDESTDEDDDDDDDDESEEESDDNDENNIKASGKSNNRMNIDLASSNSENSRESKKRRKRMRKQIDESSNEDEAEEPNANNNHNTNKENSKIINKSTINNASNLATSSNFDINVPLNTKKRKKDDMGSTNKAAIMDNHLILNQNMANNNKNQLDSSSNDCVELKDATAKKPSNSSTIPSNISQDLKEKVNKLIEIYKRQRNISTDPYTNEFKAQLFIVYNETLKLNSQDIKSQLFNFISESVEKNKDSLFRVCRRMKNAKSNKNETNTSNNNNNNNINNNHNNNSIKQQHQPRQMNTSINNNSNQRSYLTSPSPSPSKLTGPAMQINSFSDLELDLQTKINEISRKFQQFKQQVKTDDHLKFFFDNPNARNQILMIQNQIIRYKNIRPNIKEFIITHFSREFGVNRDEFLHKFDSTITLIRNTNFLNRNINELKKEIDLLMPQCFANYQQEHQKYIQNKKAEENSATNNQNNQNDPNKKKLTAPRKRFTWNEKTRELFKQICLNKINILKLNGQNVNVADENTLRDFFQADIITLWPEAWMQMNVLLQKYQQLIIQQPQPTIQQQPVQQQTVQQQTQRYLQASPNSHQSINRNLNSHNINRNTSSAPSTPIANNMVNKTTNNSNNKLDTISISSKSGKPVVIESYQTNKASNLNLVQQTTNKSDQVQNSQQIQLQQLQHKLSQNRNVTQPVQTTNNNKQNIYRNIDSSNNNNNNNDNNNNNNSNLQMRRQNSSNGPLNNLNKSISSSTLNQNGNNNPAKSQINNLGKPQNHQHQQNLHQIQQQTYNAYLNLHQNANPLTNLNQGDLAVKIQNFQQNPQKLNEFLLANIKGSNGSNNQ